jgi:hypothetical protein
MAIPRNDNKFNNFLNSSNTYLNASSGGIINYVRLGITVPERNKWNNYANTQWAEVWDKLIDPSQKTKSVVDIKDDLKLEIINFMSPILIRVSVNSAVNPTDRNTLNLPLPDRQPTPRGPILDVPYANLISFAGGRVEIRTRLNEDASRASMHPLADAVEMRYQIGGTPPITAADCVQYLMSKKALFEFLAGQENGNQSLYVFLRWVNLSNPENSGQWTTVHSVTIQK